MNREGIHDKSHQHARKLDIANFATFRLMFITSVSRDASIERKDEGRRIKVEIHIPTYVWFTGSTSPYYYVHRQQTNAYFADASAVCNMSTAETQPTNCISPHGHLTLAFPERCMRHREKTYPDCGNCPFQNTLNQCSRFISEVECWSPT